MYREKHRIPLLRQSPYSPDLNLCDRFLFHWLKQQLQKDNAIFSSPEDVERHTLQVLRSFSEDVLRKELDKLILHCDYIISSNGCY